MSRQQLLHDFDFGAFFFYDFWADDSAPTTHSGNNDTLASVNHTECKNLACQVKSETAKTEKQKKYCDSVR